MIDKSESARCALTLVSLIVQKVHVSLLLNNLVLRVGEQIHGDENDEFASVADSIGKLTQRNLVHVNLVQLLDLANRSDAKRIMRGKGNAIPESLAVELGHVAYFLSLLSAQISTTLTIYEEIPHKREEEINSLPSR
jgi:hypothetical protein